MSINYPAGSPAYGVFPYSAPHGSQQLAQINALDYWHTEDIRDAGAMVNRAIAAGASRYPQGFRLYLPADLYLVTTPIALNTPGVQLVGDGRQATILQPAASWTPGAALIVVSENWCGVRDLAIIGASQTYSNNPAGDGIDVTASYVADLSDLYIAFMNGWGVSIATTAGGTGYSPSCHNVYVTRCAGGFKVQGIAPNNSIGAVFTNCAGDQAQLNDAFLFQDAVDVQLTNCGGYSIGAGASCIHIKGGGFIWIGQGDFGATNAGVGPCVLIESGTGSPSNVALVGNSLEKGSTGVSISAGTDHMLIGNGIYFNQTHGIAITGGAGVAIVGNTFDGNGQTAGAGHYDIWQNTGSGNPVLIEGNVFRTAQGTGAGQVAAAIHPQSTATKVIGNDFEGASGANALSSAAGYAANNPGYNPVGVLTPPSVPATTVAQANTFGVGVTVYVTGGTVTAIAVNGSATGLTSGPIHLGPGQTITLTYSAAPTWQWFGD